jgi:hypothetical protein
LSCGKRSSRAAAEWKTFIGLKNSHEKLLGSHQTQREVRLIFPVRPPSELTLVSLEGISIKSSPLDIEIFRQETSVKYPTFTSPPDPFTVNVSTSSAITPSKLAEAFSPIPVRHHYEHDVDADMQNNQHGFHPGGHQQPGGMQFRPGVPQAATPAPSPPPSPKPNKQKYQTDQNRPFLFPFSRRATHGGYRDSRDGRLVPFAIDEADTLYHKHMYVSLSLWQMWRAREECMSAESGLAFMPGSELIADSKPQQSVGSLTSCPQEYEWCKTIV